MKHLLRGILRFVFGDLKSRLFPNFRLNRYLPFWDSFYSWLTRAAKSHYEPDILGHKMYLDDRDSLELSIFKVYEPLETELLVSLIPQGGVVIDIGANIGYYSLQFARKVGLHGKVFAFEPDPGNFALLTKNLQANGYRNVTPLQVAVSNRSGELRLFVSEENRGDHRVYAAEGARNSIKIAATTLDDFFADQSTRADLIKMDIQGAEFAALSGMTKTLSRWHDVILVTEFWPYGLKQSGADPNAVIELLLAQGFSLEEVSEGDQRLRPLDPAKFLANLPTEFGYSTNLLCRRKALPLGT